MKSREKSTVNGDKTDGKRSVNREKTQKATLAGGIQGKHSGSQAWVYLERLRGLKPLWLYFPLCISFQLKLLVVGQALKSLVTDVLTRLNKTSPCSSFRSGEECEETEREEVTQKMGKRQRWKTG